MSCNSLRRSLLLAGTLLLLTGGQAVQAAPDAGPSSWEQRRDAMQRRQAAAFNRMSSSQRLAFLEAMEQLEQRRSQSQLALLSETRRCLQQARDSAAEQACQRNWRSQRLEQRRQMQAEHTALRQRFGLPGREGRQRGGSPAGQPGARPLEL